MVGPAVGIGLGAGCNAGIVQPVPQPKGDKQACPGPVFLRRTGLTRQQIIWDDKTDLAFLHLNLRLRQRLSAAQPDAHRAKVPPDARQNTSADPSSTGGSNCIQHLLHPKTGRLLRQFNSRDTAGNIDPSGPADRRGRPAPPPGHAPKTRIALALRTVDRRWAMTKTVRPCISWSMPFSIRASVRVSIEEVASSRSAPAGLPLPPGQ